jgi:hypothetical protein
MAVTISNMIFLGNFADVDTNESNWAAESPNSLLGTYNSFSGLESVSVTNHDVDNDGAISDNEFGGGDYVEYTRDGIAYSAKSDSTMDFWVRITDADGVVHDIEVVGIQMDNGDVFITDLDNAGTLDNLTIRSVEVYSIPRTNFSGYRTNQSISNTTVCYAAGTMIRSVCGDVLIETLHAGDCVLTLDNGLRPLRWIGSETLSHPGTSAPIAFAPDSLGPGRPNRPLHVSPQHRMVVEAPVVRRMFNCEQVMLPAKRLLGLPGVTQTCPDRPVVYWHLLCERHEVILANGTPSETLLLGPVAFEILSDRARREIAALSLTEGGKCLLAANQQTARMVPPGTRQRQLIRRMAKNAGARGSAVHLRVGSLPGQDALEPARLVK